MSSIKKNMIIKIFIFIIILPIHLYISNDQFSFNECLAGYPNVCIAIGIGTILLLLLMPYYLLKNRIYFLLSLSLFLVFIIEYLFFRDSTLILRSIKSFLPFLFLLSFLSMRSNIQLNNKSIKFYLEKYIPYILVLFQIIIIISTTKFFENRSEIFFLMTAEGSERHPNFLINTFKIYNYNQYFSFILVLVSGVRIFVSTRKIEILFFILVMIYGCLDARNYSAFISAIIIILLKILYPFLSKVINVKNLYRLIGYFFVSLIFLMPIFSFLNEIPSLSDSINGKHLDTLIIRLDRWVYIISNLHILNLLSGIYPDPFLIQQPHNQFLEYVLFFGFIKSAFLIGLIYFMISKISEIKYFIPISIILGIGGAITEIISHLYTSQIIFMYIIFSSYVSRKKSD